MIGIWCDDGRTCVAIKHTITDSACGEYLLNSELAHVDERSKVAGRFGLSTRDEYFVIPRGRVDVVRETGAGIIYHGRATTADRLKVIAAEFRLNSWKAQLDDRYATGEDAERLFQAE